jgi:hypothetical protein
LLEVACQNGLKKGDKTHQRWVKSPFFVGKSFKFIIFIHFSWANPNLFWPNLIFSLCLLVKSQFWLLNNFAEMEMMNYWDDGYGQISTTEVHLVL